MSKEIRIPLSYLLPLSLLLAILILLLLAPRQKQRARELEIERTCFFVQPVFQLRLHTDPLEHERELDGELLLFVDLIPEPPLGRNDIFVDPDLPVPADAGDIPLKYEPVQIRLHDIVVLALPGIPVLLNLDPGRI